MTFGLAMVLYIPMPILRIATLFPYTTLFRSREHFQLNMDLIGEGGPLADAELIAAAVDILRAFGFGPEHVQARISDRRVLKALLLGRGLTEAQLPIAFGAIDRTEREQPAAVESRLVQAGVAKEQAEAVLETGSLRGLGGGVAGLARGKGGADAAEPLRE